jgi:2-oxoisovalerate dehydrogenase E1 component
LRLRFTNVRSLLRKNSYLRRYRKRVAMSEETASTEIQTMLDKALYRKAYRLMCIAGRMAALYEERRQVCSKYVHSTSRGHEAIQLATAFQLTSIDFAAPYYRDDSMLLGIGMQPYELMLQLLAKAEDPFSGGRTYYAHPSLKREGMPTIPHQSSATGMQAIPSTGMAHGLRYLEGRMLLEASGEQGGPVVLCSLGDGSVTEGEVAEAFQMAILKKLPVVYLVQDNNWGISATGAEMRVMSAYEYAAGFPGLERITVDGSDFTEAYGAMERAFSYARKERAPVLVHATCPLLGHHTSGVRKEFYREQHNLQQHQQNDPLPKLRNFLLEEQLFTDAELLKFESEAAQTVEVAFERALQAPDPKPETVMEHEFAPTPVQEEQGERAPAGAEKVLMVDAALHAIDEILRKHPESLLYGQDVGARLGGVFREAATLGDKYGKDRVFNTPIQEAYIVGSTVGMSAVGCRPIVEIQFADYIWPGMNQLVEELSKSCYLSRGQFPVSAVIRVPIGAYGGGGPYHSGSIESTLLNIRGIKVAYPSNAADMKGLMKAAYYDPNPVIMLEHKGLYWGKVPGTEEAKALEPDENYIIPLGKARVVQQASDEKLSDGDSCGIITYGMGVHWARAASKSFAGQVEILDLRSLNPLDWDACTGLVERHGKLLILTEEPLLNSFAESLAGRLSLHCFKQLDAPVMTMGALPLPAVPLNVALEKAMLPNVEKVAAKLEELLGY